MGRRQLRIRSLAPKTDGELRQLKWSDATTTQVKYLTHICSEQAYVSQFLISQLHIRLTYTPERNNTVLIHSPTPLIASHHSHTPPHVPRLQPQRTIARRQTHPKAQSSPPLLRTMSQLQTEM